MVAQAQEADDAGVLGRVRNAINAGIGWLTTARKHRGLLSSMQGVEPMLLLLLCIRQSRVHLMFLLLERSHSLALTHTHVLPVHDRMQATEP